MSTVRIQVRRGTASQWTSVNPILAAGEMGVESDTNLFKFGNGSSTWTALAYANNSDVAIGEISQDAINTALSMGSGLTKTYNDGANTITINVDSNVVALKSYVDSQITSVANSVTSLGNTVDSDYIPISDRGQPNGVASLDSSRKIPNDQIDENNFATKVHVAAVASGLQIKLSVAAASTENFASTRAAGSADASGGTGIGETLTASANGALIIDGVTLSQNDRVLLKNQSDAKQNGIYVVTNAGDASTAAVLTRATDADNSVDGEVREGMFTFTQAGTANARDGYVLLAEASRAGEIFQLGTDSLTFSQFTGAIPVSVGTGLTNVNDIISVDTSSIATKASVDGVITSVGQLVTVTDGHASSISSIITKNNEQDTTLTSHTTTLAGIATKNTEQDSAISQNTTDIATNASGLAAAVSVNNTQNTRLTSLEAADTTLGGQIAAANTAIADLETELRADLETKAAVDQLETLLRTDLAPKNDTTLTGTVTLPTATSIGNVSSTEIGYLDGVTSGIQGQIDSKLATSAAASTYETISNVALKAPLDSPTFTGTVSGITKSMVGLANVDNTADDSKPVSTAQAAAIAQAKSEALAEVTAVIAGAPAALNTLDELAAALNDDANFASTVTTAIAGKVASYTTVTTKTANFGINDADYHDGWLDVDSTGDVTITVPADGTNSLTYPVGTSFDIFRVNTGQVTISGSGATVNGTPGLKLRARYSSATLFKRAANTWVLIGDLTA